ncbi:hypothetical protein [Brevibacillus dissolubilis]|uniref:hypothetical protein n=1 Tax=Brevibacillus dissolubilis TaxID=1844116 RepID=UPI001116757F|nr:hypothetical protein [Brevibacillus dissolubilis]
MTVEERIQTTLQELTNDGLFHIEKWQYDAEYFGNIYAILTSDRIGVEVRFTMDRGTKWCELTSIANPHKTFALTELLDVFGVPYEESGDNLADMLGMMSLASKLIRQMQHIFHQHIEP